MEEKKQKEKRGQFVSDGCYSSLREAPLLPAEEKWRVYLKATEGIEDTTGILQITVLFQKLPFLSLHIQKSHCQGLIIMKWSLKTETKICWVFIYLCGLSRINNFRKENQSWNSYLRNVVLETTYHKIEDIHPNRDKVCF